MRKRRTEAGFTYLAALILIAVLGAGLAAAGELWHTAQQREKERELLFIGHQFRAAITQYYQRTPGPIKRYPARIEDLLQDPRYPGANRYLRKLYRDPVTGKTEWGLAPAPTGGIMGIYSLSEDVPLKTANFSFADRDFEGKEKYADWKFSYLPPQPAPAPRL